MSRWPGRSPLQACPVLTLAGGLDRLALVLAYIHAPGYRSCFVPDASFIDYLGFCRSLIVMDKGRRAPRYLVLKAGTIAAGSLGD
jgi:hypothetical protein